MRIRKEWYTARYTTLSIPLHILHIADGSQHQKGNAGDDHDLLIAGILLADALENVLFSAAWDRNKKLRPKTGAFCARAERENIYFCSFKSASPSSSTLSMVCSRGMNSESIEPN